jgi:2-dehydropantoate 2-reductase
MKVAIYGAGAIGGLIGAHLARTGQDVTLIARGPHLAALKDKGLHLTGHSGEFTVHPKATEDAREAGPQDFVIVALKANAVPGIADKLAPLLGPDTGVVMAVNGVPWWYFYGAEGALRDARLPSVDPEDKLWQLVGPERVIGCVVYPAAEVVAPGHIHHVENDRFSLGEASGIKTDRVAGLSAAFIAAGFKAPVKPDIRTEIWVKLWGNVAFNPSHRRADLPGHEFVVAIAEQLRTWIARPMPRAGSARRSPGPCPRAVTPSRISPQLMSMSSIIAG